MKLDAALVVADQCWWHLLSFGEATSRAHAMKYSDGSAVKLGDVVTIPFSDRSQRARVVMLGDSREHLDIDEFFVEWVESEGLLAPTQVVVEWIDRNPLAHNDPNYAPAGNYMFMGLDDCVRRET